MTREWVSSVLAFVQFILFPSLTFPLSLLSNEVRSDRDKLISGA